MGSRRSRLQVARGIPATGMDVARRRASDRLPNGHRAPNRPQGHSRVPDATLSAKS